MSRLRRRHLLRAQPPLSVSATLFPETHCGTIHRAKEEEELKGEEYILKAISRLFRGRRPPSPPALDSALSPFLARLSHTDSLLHALSLLPSPSSAPVLFLSALRLGSPLADHRAVGKALQILLRSRDLQNAHEFLLSLPYPSPLLRDTSFNALIRALACAGHLRRAIHIFRLMPVRGVPLSVFSFNSLITALLHRGRTRAATRLFHLMLRIRVKPDTVTFNALIRGFFLNAMLPEALQVFRLMFDHHCDPDIITYNTLLNCFCRAGKVSTARKLFEQMRNKSPDLVPNVVSYTTLVRGYCSQLMVVEAVELFEEMVANGLKPNNITKNTLMKGFCDAGRLDLVKNVLDNKSAFRPDTCTFNTLIAAHCAADNVEEALKLFDGLSKLRVKADSATYSTLIRRLCYMGKFDKAEALVDDLIEQDVLRTGACVPLMAAYNPIIEYLCRSGRAKKARKLLRELLQCRATVDIVAFKTVILGCCREGALVEGYKLLVSMVMRDLKPDYETSEVLLKGFILKGDIAFALEALKRMLDSGHRAATDTFHSILSLLLRKDGYANEAADVVQLMLDRKILQNIDLSTTVVGKLFGNGLNERAFDLVVKVYASGFRLKMEKLVDIRCQEKKFLEARGLLLFSLEKKEELDPPVFCRVIDGLCSIERASEAFDLFYNAIEEYSASVFCSCMNSLKVALERTGGLKEAEFVCKQISYVKFAKKVNDM